MTPVQDILAILSGSAVGFSLGLLGGGGSILAVPLLLYVVGYHDAHVVIGTTALAVGITALVNLVPHWRAGTVRWRTAVLLALPGVAGALLGAAAGRHVAGHRLLFLFAVLMLVVAWRMFRAARAPKPVPPPAACLDHPSRCTAGSGLGVGLLSGFFGVGGGFLIVPSLMFAVGLPILVAIGTSLVAVAAFGLTTAASYAAGGQVAWLIAAEFVAGGIAGGLAGTRVAVRLGRRRVLLTRMFATSIVAVALYMLVLNAAALG